MKRAGPDYNISKTAFRDVLKSRLTPFPSNAQQQFLERLFDAFDTNGNQVIDFREFIVGLSTFIKGNSHEKLACTSLSVKLTLKVSFKLYDVDRDGFITRKELTGVLTQMLSSMFPDEDPTMKVNDIVRRLFDDLDVNEDGHLVCVSEFCANV